MSQDLMRQHQLLSAELQHHQSVMMLIDVESGQILDANDAAAVFYGYSIVDLRNMHIQQINVLPEDQIQAEMQRAHQEKRNQFIFPHRLASGDIRRVEVFASPVVSESGQKMLLSVVHDISNLVLDNTPTLRDYKKQLEQLVTQRTQEATLANLKFKRILMAGLATAVLFNGLLLFNIQKRRRAIRSLRVEVMQRQAAEEEIRQLAFFDPLTRLPNRRHLLDRLQRALLNANRNHLFGALLFIDLDNFKSLNDTMGHDVGDVLLQQVAQRLRESVREADTVARLGGDEFVILLEGVSDHEPTVANTAEMVSNKIIARLNQPFELVSQKHYSTPSIGAAIFGYRTHEGVDELLKHADLAMYQAKASGRNALRFFDPDMQTAVEVRAAMETDLRNGMEAKQFELLYQAQVDDDGQMMGAEALLRWNHPERGVVSPAEFIPLAEESGLIHALGKWVLEVACERLAKWAKDANSSHLTLAVNVSVKQFNHRDFVKQVLDVLQRTQAPAHRLKLELTESLLLYNMDSAIGKMTELQAHGISFSLDDFGTGYSSLSYLRRLPFDQLKIDRSFVQDVLTNQNDTAIARAILGLGQSLGLTVIAEGVENAHQHELLRKLGCRKFQGYFFGRPGSAQQCLDMLDVSSDQVTPHKIDV